MLRPSASRARRSRTLLRMASAPTSRAGRTISRKPNRSFRWKVTRQTYRENWRATGPVVGQRRPRSLQLVDRPERAIDADASASVADPRLDQGIASRRHRSLGVGGLHRSRNAGLETLLRLGQLLLGQTEPLVGDGHLLLGRCQVEHGLAGLSLHLVTQVPLVDLLDLHSGGLLLGAVLPPEAVQNRHVQEELQAICAGEVVAALPGLTIQPADAQVGQVFLADGGQGTARRRRAGALGGELGSVLPGVRRGRGRISWQIQ